VEAAPSGAYGQRIVDDPASYYPGRPPGFMIGRQYCDLKAVPLFQGDALRRSIVCNEGLA